MATNDPQTVTIRGRLSWPNFTYAQALKQNTTSKWPRKEEDVKPNFSLLLDEAQSEKLINHLRDVFIPWCVEQEKAGLKSPLDPKQAKKLTKILDEADWETEDLFGLIKPVHEKTVDLAPEAVMTVRVNGRKGYDLPLKAVVRSESELANPTEEIIIPERGLILPVKDTTHELYPGSIVGAQLNLFAFESAGRPGITASADAAIFMKDAERFGGGGAIDEDALFMDMED